MPARALLRCCSFQAKHERGALAIVHAMQRSQYPARAERQSAPSDRDGKRGYCSTSEIVKVLPVTTVLPILANEDKVGILIKP